MDERMLNINAPLMSVRRPPATSPTLTEAKRKESEKQHTLAYYLETEPVAVPFNWEHIPGRPKGNNDGSESQPPKEASITPSPSVPPGKSTNFAKHPLEKECHVADKFRSLGKPNSLSGRVSILIDCEKERKDEKISSTEEEDEDDDVYSDALETLSPTESLSMNCSLSGVSGLDHLDTNKSGTYSTDKQTQDFMMSRFLPAAKAMTLHPPQYASSRKQSVLVEQPSRDITRLVRKEKKSLVNEHILDIVPYAGQCQEEEKEEEESEDETNDYDETANISAKGCGLLPRLYARNSLCLLNPVPGMKTRNQFPKSTTYEKPNKSSNIRSYSPAPAIKKAWDAIHKSKSSSGAASPEMHEVRKKWTSSSNRFTYSGEMKQQDRLSPFRRSTRASFQNQPQFLFPEAKLLGDSKQAESNNNSGRLKFPSRRHGSIQEVLPQGTKKSSNSGSLAIEKTLYIDTTSTEKLSISCSDSCSVDKTHAVLDRREGKVRNSITEQPQKLEDNLDSEILNSLDADSSTLSPMLLLKHKEHKAERLKPDQEINQEPMSLQLVQRSFDRDTEINNQQIVAVDHSGKDGAEYALSLPLPKSPSESWLRHALPLVSSKNSFPHHARRQGPNAASGYTKWETIVRTSSMSHDHVCCSQELTIYKSPHSKS